MPSAAGWFSGICNGFQILCEAGLLPGVLMRNAGRRFICKMQHLRVENAATPFDRGYVRGQVIKVAIAHGEGNYMADAETIATSRSDGPRGVPILRRQRAVGGAANPNGSMNDIAGIYSERFNVLGLMPHPENLIDPLVGGVDGRAHVRRRWPPLDCDESMNLRSDREDYREPRIRSARARWESRAYPPPGVNCA